MLVLDSPQVVIAALAALMIIFVTAPLMWWLKVILQTGAIDRIVNAVFDRVNEWRLADDARFAELHDRLSALERKVQ